MSYCAHWHGYFVRWKNSIVGLCNLVNLSRQSRSRNTPLDEQCCVSGRKFYVEYRQYLPPSQLGLSQSKAFLCDFWCTETTTFAGSALFQFGCYLRSTENLLPRPTTYSHAESRSRPPPFFAAKLAKDIQNIRLRLLAILPLVLSCDIGSLVRVGLQKKPACQSSVKDVRGLFQFGRRSLEASPQAHLRNPVLSALLPIVPHLPNCESD